MRNASDLIRLIFGNQQISTINLLSILHLDLLFQFFIRDFSIEFLFKCIWFSCCNDKVIATIWKSLKNRIFIWSLNFPHLFRLKMQSYRQTQIDSTPIDSGNEFYKTFSIFWKTTLDLIHYFFNYLFHRSWKVKLPTSFHLLCKFHCWSKGRPLHIPYTILLKLKLVVEDPSIWRNHACTQKSIKFNCQHRICSNTIFIKLRDELVKLSLQKSFSDLINIKGTLMQIWKSPYMFVII